MWLWLKTVKRLSSAPDVKIRFWLRRITVKTPLRRTTLRSRAMAPNHWGGPQERSGLLNVMAHNWFKRALTPWPTRCNWSIWKRVTQPLAEIAALIVLYVELRPRCNESNLSPLVPAGDGVAQGPSQLCERRPLWIIVLHQAGVCEITPESLCPLGRWMYNVSASCLFFFFTFLWFAEEIWLIQILKESKDRNKLRPTKLKSVPYWSFSRNFTHFPRNDFSAGGFCFINCVLMIDVKQCW